MIVKTCDLPVTREKTVAKTSFLCGFRDRGESSNPLTHATVKECRKPLFCVGFLFVNNTVVVKKSACYN